MSWLDEMPERRPGLVAKRALDVVLAGAGLIALAPVMGAATLVGLAAHGWPPTFVQERPGLHGKTFRMVKLRTMTNAKDADGRLLPDAERLTAVGKLMRATSLDELPELWNVLRGDMSLVGPRPLLVRYLARYTPEQMLRHDMPPGITGWAQVRGRNALSWEAKFAHDVWYVDHWSFALDLRILAETVWTVVRREGIAAEGEATMPEFMGGVR
jgi:lipopolysaccharide/colanic/teichoic acid biosynthesis glycosyltransferase